MRQIPPNVHARNVDIVGFCAKWRIVELALFGSAARGELRPDSDIDVMLAFEPDAPWSLLDLAWMKRELEDMMSRSVVLVEKGTIRNPYRLRSINRDLTVLYAA
jgi:predicted nucleotidyltransferase